MRTPALLLTLPLVAVLTACGGNDDQASRTPSPTPSATESGPTCTPSGKGTTDLTTKPAVAKHTGPAPAETTWTDIVCGTGDLAGGGDSVKVKYVGVLYSNGTEFDASWNQSKDYTFSFQLGGGVIPGFSKGVEGMRVGGRREVVIPARDGYGAQGRGAIPANAPLIFVIDLVKVG